jgi:Protein of unknown function (DUF2927)
MRILSLCCLVALGACAAQPEPMNWQSWLAAERSMGRMRDDPAPPDAPFDNAMVARNFRTIAFDVERDPFATGQSRGAYSEARILRRWPGPVRWAVYASPAEQARVQPLVHDLAVRLGGLTARGFYPASTSGPGPAPANLQLWIVPEQVEGMLRSFPTDPPQGSDAGRVFQARIADFIRTWYRTAASPCAAQFFSVDRPAAEAGTILGALVLIRAGLPDALLRSCIEEELAQAMGLPNDDADVRPSIFNDGKEFGVLTAHDELLLRILYDPRLEPGMTPTTAMPVVRRIIAELRPAG